MNQKKKLKAAMTVEASFILPIFMMLFMNLLSMIEVYRIHSSVAASLWEKGREVSIFGQQPIIKNLETYPVWEKIVAGGKGGFFVFGTAQENGIIQIDCSYVVKPLFSSFTPVSKQLNNHYYGHAWVGYIHGGEAAVPEESYVFITETGTVYHKNRGCSYLNPSVRNAAVGELSSLRNKNGGIYYACPLCGDFPAEGNYYVTDYGTNYHTRIACSGLKRTIYTVKLSEVNGRSACSRCGV